MEGHRKRDQRRKRHGRCLIEWCLGSKWSFQPEYQDGKRSDRNGGEAHRPRACRNRGSRKLAGGQMPYSLLPKRVARGSANRGRRSASLSSALVKRQSQPNRQSRSAGFLRRRKIVPPSPFFLKKTRHSLGKDVRKGFRQRGLGNLVISANFGGIHFEAISEAL